MLDFRQRKNKKFKRFLKSKGIKAIWLSEKMNVNEKTVKSWIKGNRPAIRQIIELSKIFNMPIESMYQLFKEN